MVALPQRTAAEAAIKSVPVERLDELKEELHALSAWLLDRFVREQIAPERIGGVSTSISQIHHAIERRRKAS